MRGMSRGEPISIGLGRVEKLQSLGPAPGRCGAINTPFPVYSPASTDTSGLGSVEPLREQVNGPPLVPFGC